MVKTKIAEYELSLQALSEVPHKAKQQDGSMAAIQLIIAQLKGEAKALSQKISQAKDLEVKGRELLEAASKLRMNATVVGQGLCLKSL